MQLYVFSAFKTKNLRCLKSLNFICFTTNKIKQVQKFSKLTSCRLEYWHEEVIDMGGNYLNGDISYCQNLQVERKLTLTLGILSTLVTL